MKYKLIIVFFNFFMLLSFLAVFFLPVSVLGWSYIGEFWRENWYLPVLFLFLIAGLNIFFIVNWSMLRYVEKGDWAALVPLLEERIYGKKIITYSNIRLFVHSCLLLGEGDKVKKLEEHIRSRKKRLYNRTFLMFSSARFLTEKSENLIPYMKEAFADKSLKGGDWIAVNYAFVLIASGCHDEALKALESLKGKRHPAVLELTFIYLSYLCSPFNERKNYEALKDGFTAGTGIEKFNSMFEREKGEMHVLFFTKIIEQARDWAYGDKKSDKS